MNVADEFLRMVAERFYVAAARRDSPIRSSIT